MEIETPFKHKLMEQLEDRIFKRKLVLWQFYIKGLSQKAIQEETGIPTSTINDIIKKWDERGVIEDLTRSGRKKVITKKQENKIKRMQLTDRSRTAKSIQQEIVSSGDQVSYDQTLRVINDTFKSMYARYKIYLLDEHKKKRVTWCQNAIKWRDSKWKTIVWTDEKIFRTQPQHQKIRVKLLFDEDPNQFSFPLKQQGGKGIMCYAAISSKGKIFFGMLEGKIDSGDFAKFLTNSVLPAVYKNHGLAFRLQQDNAPVHKGETTSILKREHIDILDWPPKSPDLNPVEQVWNLMSLKLKGKLFQNIEELKEAVFEVWEEISNKLIFTFIDKIKAKIIWVAENNGELYPDHK